MNKKVYGRLIILKNCGRFLNIESDFGSEYKTHPFLTEQMTYAGLTRENKLINNDEVKIEKGIVPEKYNFNRRYNIPNGRYFTCGYIINKEKLNEKGEIELWSKNRNNTDINDFNSIDETNAGVQENEKMPKFGNIESLLPNNYFIVFAFSLDKEYLKNYYLGQTFYMGKKRTMFQIENISNIRSSTENKIKADIQLPIQIERNEIKNFDYYNIVTLTRRYMLIKGKTDKIKNFSWKLDYKNIQNINLPSFFIKKYLMGE